MAPLEILIVGCSIAGPALATCLLLAADVPAAETPHVTVLERSPAVRPEGQNIDVRGAGLTVLRHLGLERVVRASTTGEAGVRWVDAADRVWAEFPANRAGDGATAAAASSPTADVEILRGRLADILYRRARALGEEVRAAGGPGVDFVFGDRLDRIEQQQGGPGEGRQRVKVRFAGSGETRLFDVVVGADGLQSGTRRLVWGAEGDGEWVRGLGQGAGASTGAGAGPGVYGAFFSMPAGPGDSLWRRWFRAPRRRAIMVRPGARRDRVTVFMSLMEDRDERLAAAAGKGREEGVQMQKALMVEYFQDAGWESGRVTREMMDADDFYYDMIAQVKMEKWHHGRVVLLGDAGYCASPFSGMGTTLALTGAWNLAGAILRHPHDLERAFVEYENSMRPVVDRAQKLAPGIPGAFHPRSSWGVWLINFLVFLLDRLRFIGLLLKLGAGPPAQYVPVQDFGFRKLPEMAENPQPQKTW